MTDEPIYIPPLPVEIALEWILHEIRTAAQALTLAEWLGRDDETVDQIRRQGLHALDRWIAYEPPPGLTNPTKQPRADLTVWAEIIEGPTDHLSRR